MTDQQSPTEPADAPEVLAEPQPEIVTEAPADVTPDVAPEPVPAVYATAPVAAPAPGTTDPLAIAGLVCAFLVWPVGIGLSIAALVRTRRTGQGGRGLAIGGIVVGALGLIGTVLSVVMLFVVGGPLADAIDAEVQALESSQPTESVAAPSPSAADESAAGEAVEAPAADGTWTAPATAAGLTGQARACEILFSDDPSSLMSIIVSTDPAADPDAVFATLGQVFDAARADLDPALAADATTLQALFLPETYMLPAAELEAASLASEEAGDRLAAACGVTLS